MLNWTYSDAVGLWSPRGTSAWPEDSEERINLRKLGSEMIVPDAIVLSGR